MKLTASRMKTIDSTRQSLVILHLHLRLNINLIINHIALKLLRLKLPREHNVKFLISPPLTLWKAEEAPKRTQETETACQEARFALPVSLGRIQYYRATVKLMMLNTL